MNNRPEIYLDMDGVCVDFMGAAMTAQGYEPESLMAAWREIHAGELFPESLINKRPEEFFTHENLGSSDFWAGLIPYPWFERLYEELDRLGHVVFLTAPTGQPGCVSGKHEWLINQFGHEFHDFIFTRHKSRVAQPNAYLVDDLPFNIESFNRRRGIGVLFPQLWNELHEIDDPVLHVIEQLEQQISAAPG